MSAPTYARHELLRTLRNRRFLIFSFLFPLVLYIVIAVPNRDENDIGGTGLSAPLYLMVGLLAFGAMTAVLSSGARIAAERAVDWNRQLRVTPLTARADLRAKVATAYAMAAGTIVLLYAAGIALGVRLSARDWLEMTALVLIGLLPFVPLGILLGHVLSADSIGPAMGGLTALLALLGGSWFPLDGALKDIGEVLPSYWLVQASHVATGGRPWTATGWVVVAAWTAVLTVLAARAYRRDTRRA
jgi:ABC-2 type transport system permease protein